MSNGRGLKPAGLVGAAQTVCTEVSVSVAVAVTVGPGSVTVGPGSVTVGPGSVRVTN